MYDISAKDQKIIIVISEFNAKIIERLLQGAINAFLHYDGLEKNIQTFRVPGAFEIPGAINQVLKYHSPNAIIALGAVIRGETPHFEYIAGESSKGLLKLAQYSNIPIINGILTTNNVRQAIDRSDIDKKNKGWDAMESALHTINTYQRIQSPI